MEIPWDLIGTDWEQTNPPPPQPFLKMKKKKLYPLVQA